MYLNDNLATGGSLSGAILFCHVELPNTTMQEKLQNP